MLMIRPSDWQVVLDLSLATFRRNLLAALCLRTKPEQPIRDALSVGLQTHLGMPSQLERPVEGGRVDIVILGPSGTPKVWVELKTGYTFDAYCSGGASLLVGGPGHRNSVAFDVAKLKRVARGEAYVLYSAVHPNGPLPFDCQLPVDYRKKHDGALRDLGSASLLIAKNERMCDVFGKTGRVNSSAADPGDFPITRVLAHHADLGHALGVPVSLYTWVWRVPLSSTRLAAPVSSDRAY